MISDLTTAWQASATVDADLAKWATDAAGHCRKGNLNDPNYTATIPFDSKATNGKIAFVKLWNPLARRTACRRTRAQISNRARNHQRVVSRGRGRRSRAG